MAFVRLRVKNVWSCGASVQSAQVSQDEPQKFFEINVIDFIASKKIELEKSSRHCCKSAT